MSSGQTVFEHRSSKDLLEALEVHAKIAGQELATTPDAEILQYLAKNGAAATRKAVAENTATPPDANALLAEDCDDDVRQALAGKIGRLLPGLLAIEQTHLKALTLATLERLARDAVASVRAMLAEEIKAMDCVPENIVRQLSLDVETIVATPIVEYSPKLSDEELLEIIASAQARDVLSAVARRKAVSETISDALVETLDVAAIAALLLNGEANIRKKTLDTIVAKAAEHSEWHGPLTTRADLPADLVRRIASFVGTSLIETLARRHSLDAETKESLERELDQRVGRASTPSRRDMPRNEIEAALGASKIDDAFVQEAALAGQRDSVIFALSGLTGVRTEIVRKILALGSAKPLTALVWRAKLSMTTSEKIQTLLMRLTHPDVLRARADGGFPLSESDMRCQLNFFEIET